jgi:D-alanyl-lipoteichoic acid acyltransferase DltB (MBOAT superfamily)
LRPQSPQADTRWSFARQAGATAITFHFVILSFAIAKEDSLGDAMRVFRILFTGG